MVSYRLFCNVGAIVIGVLCGIGDAFTGGDVELGSSLSCGAIEEQAVGDTIFL